MVEGDRRSGSQNPVEETSSNRMLVGKLYEDVLKARDEQLGGMIHNPLVRSLSGPQIFESEDEEGQTYQQYGIRVGLRRDLTDEEQASFPDNIDGIPIEYAVVSPIIPYRKK